MPSTTQPPPSMDQSEFVLVLCTAGSLEEAQKLTQKILEEKLAACVNLVPEIHSNYWWKGRIEQAQEVLLLIKSCRTQLRELSEVLKRHHTYELPEIIALPILWGDPAYLDWLRNPAAPST